MPGADIEIKKINGRHSGLGSIGHFGFFREEMRNSLWPEIPEWILNLSKNK
jgi:predicted alpha/beta hydrolase